MVDSCNTERTPQEKPCQGRTPLQTFIDGKEYFAEKNIKALAMT